MAKSRYRSKGRGKGWSKAKRQAAGRKAWRTRVKRYGHAAATAMLRGRGAPKRRGGGSRYGSHRRGLGAIRGLTGPAVLAMIQRREGTVGLPPTDDELNQARALMKKLAARSRALSVKRPTSADEVRRVAFVRKIESDIKREAQHRVARNEALRKKREAEEAREKARREAEAQIQAEMARLRP